MNNTHRTEGTALRPLTLGHKHDGGTGITNFSKDQVDIYREAIRLHGDPALVASERDFSEGHEHLFSLHDLSAEKREFGLGEFWNVFELVKSLYGTRKLFGVEHTGAANWVRYRDEHARLLARNEALRGALTKTSDELELALQRMLDENATDESSDGYNESVALIAANRTLLNSTPPTKS